MGKMSYIAYLANKGNLKELTEEVGSYEVAKGFIEAAEKIEKNKDKPAYKNLSKLQKEMVKDATKKISAASVGIREIE
tara:strand:- start:256 stop:489 length:234 start_codon:yes stop_codon:yes gene_type:complete